MALDAAVIAVGLGARRGVAADALCAAVAHALPTGVRADTLATAAFKRDDPGFAEAAARLGLPILYLAEQVLAGACPPPGPGSNTVRRLVGVASVAEAAALAAAGPGARLIVPKRIVGGVACAVAEGQA